MNIVYSTESLIEMKKKEKVFKKDFQCEIELDFTKSEFFRKQSSYFFTLANISFLNEKEIYEKSEEIIELLQTFTFLNFSDNDQLKSILYGANEILSYKEIIKHLEKCFPKEKNIEITIKEACESIVALRLLAEDLEKQRKQCEGKSLLKWKDIVLSSQFHFSPGLIKLLQFKCKNTLECRKLIIKVFKEKFLENITKEKRQIGTAIKEKDNLIRKKKDDLLEKILNIQQTMKNFHQKSEDFIPFLLIPKKENTTDFQQLIKEREETVKMVIEIEKEERNLYLEICIQNNQEELKNYQEKEDKSNEFIKHEMFKWHSVVKIFTVIDQLSQYFSEMSPEKLKKSLEELKPDELLGLSFTIYICRLIEKSLLTDDENKGNKIEREYLMQNLIAIIDERNIDITKRISDTVEKMESGELYKKPKEDFLKILKKNNETIECLETKSIYSFEEKKNNL